MQQEQFFRFVPSARLQHYLGSQLIADPNLAIIEFVKNAYDAGAANLYLSFNIADQQSSSLIIADDGTGMDVASFEENWMHPGFSIKSPDAPHRSRRLPESEAAGREASRIPAGEKGIGRFAAGRLGDALDVFTRSTQGEQWLHVRFDWHAFDDMTKSLHHVGIPYDFDTPPESPPVQAGTILVISGLNQRWDTRVPGRPVVGRSRTRLGRLRQDLELLIRPLTATSNTDFTIHLDSDAVLEEDDIGTITPSGAAKSTEYQYTFQFQVNEEGQIKIDRELRRGAAASNEDAGQRVERFEARDVTPDLARVEGRPMSLECGPFRGMFLYTPPQAAHRARKIDAVGHGVLLYRDGVLVEPYGLGSNDWVGVSARKAQRQGHALIQPITFSGHVLISRTGNPGLRDMSNRQGLIEDAASESLVSHVRAEFAFFEGHIYEELSKRWAGKADKASKEAANILQGSEFRLKAVAHSLGQPLLGLSADIASLKAVARRDEVPIDIREQLLEISESAEKHIEQSEKIVRQFLDIQPASRERVDLAQLVAEVVGEVSAFADSLGVQIEVDIGNVKDVFVSRELVFEALREVVRNGIEANRPQGRQALLRISEHEHMGDPVLDVIDNGSGIPGVSPDHPVDLIGSTKGRPGQGLRTADLIMRDSLGRLRIARTGQDGSHIELHMPDLVSGLRSER